jgi:Family of unknown function (DUF7019)
MRELVYVSERKLQQLAQVETRRRSFFKRIRDVGVKAPFEMGEVTVGLGDSIPSLRSRLSNAVRDLEKSDHHIRWYAESDLTAGEWVIFEARMNFDTLSNHGRPEIGANALFFWEPDGAAQNYDARLLLHGSAEHVIGELVGNDQRVPRGFSISANFFSYLRDQGSTPSGSVGAKAFGEDVEELFVYLSSTQPAASATWLAGYARVTLPALSQTASPDTSQRNRRIVVASPLYVERIPPPG